MGDRTSIAVQIGGKLPRSAFADLIEAINSDGLALDWIEFGVTDDDVKAAIAPGEPLRLVANETYAEIGEIAALAEEHGLFWRMCWDAYPGSYSAGGQLRDAEGLTEYDCTGTDGDVMLSATEIKALGTPEAIAARIERLQRPLPAFELTGEWPADEEG